MEKGNKALAVYSKAIARFNAGKETVVDEVLLAMFDELKEKSQTVRGMALRISILEAQAGAGAQDLEPEYEALLRRMCLPAKVGTVSQQ